MARPPAKDLTERELEVMHVFWAGGDVTAADARDRLAEFEIGVQVPGVDRPPSVLEQSVLITDGPTPVAPGLLPMTELKHASAFELRVKGRVLGVLPLSPVPTATFTAEGGYKPPPEFTWSAAAEDELSDRLARLMGAPPPEN